jgi:hypothetical protein
MVPKTLQDERRGIMGLMLWLLVFFLILLVRAAYKDEWDAVAGLSGAAIAIIPAMMAYETIYQARIDKLPSLDIIIDPTSRYQLFQLGVVNNGGSPAYNVKLMWLEKDPESGRPIPVPYNCYNSPVSFCKNEQYNLIRVLPKGHTHLTMVDGYYQFYERYPQEAFFLAKISYSEKADAKSTTDVIVPVSFDEYRTTLDYSHESSKTHYELQKIPKQLNNIEASLNKIAVGLTGKSNRSI